jgi:pyruvyltransferase
VRATPPGRARTLRQVSFRAKSKYAARVATTLVRRRLDPRERARVAASRISGEEVSRLPVDPSPYAGPSHYRALVDDYVPDDALVVDGSLPLLWWTLAPNFGDLLSPWLASRMTGWPVVYAPPHTPHVVAVGSIASNARRDSVVWGAGLMGFETKWRIPRAGRYAAVRGPLTRSILRNIDYDVPRVYGDPALLAPLYFYPAVEKTHEVGLVVRWSERLWHGVSVGGDVKVINLATNNVKGVIRDLMACRAIASSSLHGLILADAYWIPNAWLDSDSSTGGSRPGGGEFKFYDYFASVNKLRHSHTLDLASEQLTGARLHDRLDFDGTEIDFDHRRLLAACPFLRPLAAGG